MVLGPIAKVLYKTKISLAYFECLICGPLLNIFAVRLVVPRCCWKLIGYLDYDDDDDGGDGEGECGKVNVMWCMTIAIIKSWWQDLWIPIKMSHNYLLYLPSTFGSFLLRNQISAIIANSYEIRGQMVFPVMLQNDSHITFLCQLHYVSLENRMTRTDFKRSSHSNCKACLIMDSKIKRSFK